MHRRLRYVLPVIQVCGAFALLTFHYVRFPLGGPMQSAWQVPERQFCLGISAPASLMQFYLVSAIELLHLSPVVEGWLEFIVETFGFLALVGLVWYMVGCGIDYRSGACSRWLFSNPPVRLLCASATVCLGLNLVYFAILVRPQFWYPMKWYGFPTGVYGNLVAIPYFIWAVFLLFVGGRGLLHNSRPPTIPS